MKILWPFRARAAMARGATTFRDARRDSLNFEAVGGEPYYRCDILALHIGAVHEITAPLKPTPVSQIAESLERVVPEELSREKEASS